MWRSRNKLCSWALWLRIDTLINMWYNNCLIVFVLFSFSSLLQNFESLRVCENEEKLSTLLLRTDTVIYTWHINCISELFFLGIGIFRNLLIKCTLNQDFSMFRLKRWLAKKRLRLINLRGLINGKLFRNSKLWKLHLPIHCSLRPCNAEQSRKKCDIDSSFNTLLLNKGNL